MTAGGYGAGGYAAGGYGSMRATDADRDNVRALLVDAHAQGRLSWEEFDTRSTALLNSQTYGELAALTTDLPNRIPASPPQVYPGMPLARQTNTLAVASLACGVGQVLFWLLSGIPAIVLGHMARRQIRQTGEDGAGMALAGLVLGYIGVGLSLIGLVLFLLLVVVVVHGAGTSQVGG